MKIKLTVDREDIERMVLGISPAYIAFDHELVKKCGSFCGGFVEEWRWSRSEIEKLTPDELVKLYLVCKMSWKINEQELRKKAKQ
jgi:hypothetical protein